jgi:hypothetical protein
VNAAFPLALLAAAWCAAAAGAGVPAVVEIPSRVGQVTFAHAPHAGIGCLDCHHTGVEQGCRACHTATATSARARREAFHGSCIGCHLADLKAGKTTGPVKRCSACHVSPSRPAP